MARRKGAWPWAAMRVAKEMDAEAKSGGGGGKDHELFDDQLDPDDDDELLEDEELLLPLLENPDDDQLSHGVACHELAPRANSWSSRMNCVCDLAVITSKLDHGRRELAPMGRRRSLKPEP